MMDGLDVGNASEIRRGSTLDFGLVAPLREACEKCGGFDGGQASTPLVDFPSPPTPVPAASVSDPESCCVACVTSDNNCGYGVFSIGQGYCLLIEGTPTCDNPGFTAGTFYETTGSNEFNTVYSNGLCGVLRDGGVVSS